MNQQLSENEEPLNLGSTERMTADEARAVIALWQARQDVSAFSDSPSVPDIAEGLEISPQEASDLLVEVRTHAQEQERQRPIESLDESGVEIGRAIEAGRLAARHNQAIADREPTAQMREVDALLDVARIRSKYLAGEFPISAVFAFLLIGLVLIVAVVLVAHLLR